MTKPGPRPAPAAVKIRAGITAPSDVNLNEPLPLLEEPVVEEPDDPAEASAGARARDIQREVLRLQHKGLITKLDDGLLEAYAQARDHRERQGRMLAVTGLVIRGRRDQLVRNPVFIAWREAILLELRLGSELGIGPAARAAIKMQPGEGLDLPDIGLPPRFRAIAGGKE